MPSQQEVKWSQLKVGVIVLVSMALLTTLLFLMTERLGHERLQQEADGARPTLRTPPA